MTEKTFEKVLLKWIKYQDTWDLQSAIYLLKQRDPETAQEDIKSEKKGSVNSRQKFGLRYFTKTKQAIFEKKMGLADHADKNLDKSLAKNWAVYKRNFIDFASDEWPEDAAPLVAALNEYDSSKSTHALTVKMREAKDVHAVVLSTIIAEYGLTTVKSLTYKRLRELLIDHWDNPAHDVYSKGSLVKHRFEITQKAVKMVKGFK